MPDIRQIRVIITGEKGRVNHTATNHGSVENINGKWYVFYHRPTHESDYSRQACAVGKICVSGNVRKTYKADVTSVQNKSDLIFTAGKGIVDILNFTLI